MPVPSILRYAPLKSMRAGLPPRRRFLLALPAWLAAVATCGRAGESRNGLLVVYPDIGEPYRGVFAQIIAGIESQAQQRPVASIAVDGNGASPELAGEPRRSAPQAVIALGRGGLKAAAVMDHKPAKVVVGGVLSVPQDESPPDFTVHSLSPDPAPLFTQLKGLMPGARRITVVYDPRQNAWLIRLAREAARAQGLELVARDALDLKNATRLYQEFAAAADPQRDVLWLPQDNTTVEDAAVVPLVMQEAWRRSFAIVSSSVAHVRRGALLSLYPDFVGHGRTLAVAALAEPGTPSGTRGMNPLTNVLTAVNTRTARHLGIDLNAARIKVDLVFPEN